MKKVVLALAAIAMVSCMVSCNKVCKCKTYVAGTVVSEKEVEVEAGKKCSEMGVVAEIAGTKNGVECSLF